MSSVKWIVVCFVACVTAITSGFATGVNFSCPFGTQGACLNPGDKVCSLLGKCVEQNAICFDAYTCGYAGFVCKLDYDELSNECVRLSREFDDLAYKYGRLQSEYDEAVEAFESLLRQYRSVQSCVAYATSLEEAQMCAM